MLEVGDIVNYVPSTDYWLERDKGNSPVFELFHSRPGPGSKDREFSGQRIPPKSQLKPGKPLQHWKAKIIAIYDENTVSLEVYHPRGKAYHQRVRRDNGHSPNSWYSEQNPQPLTKGEDHAES